MINLNSGYLRIYSAHFLFIKINIFFSWKNLFIARISHDIYLLSKYFLILYKTSVLSLSLSLPLSLSLFLYNISNYT